MKELESGEYYFRTVTINPEKQTEVLYSCNYDIDNYDHLVEMREHYLNYVVERGYRVIEIKHHFNKDGTKRYWSYP